MADIDPTVTTVTTDSDDNVVKRFKVQGGWAVYIVDATGAPKELAIVADPSHEWNPTTTNNS